jgi:hypothetical protein
MSTNRAQALASLTGANTYDVVITATLGDEVRTARVNGVRADSARRAEAQATYVATCADAELRNFSGCLMEYATTESAK